MRIPHQKLAVWRTIFGSIGFVWQNWAAFWRIGIMPMAIYTLLMSFLILTNVSAAIDEIWPGLLELAIQSLIVLSFVVAWHRFVLLGEQEIEKHRGLTYGRREWRFVLWSALVGFIVSFTSGFVFGFINRFASRQEDPSVIVSIVAIASLSAVLVAIPFIRIALILPSVALDQPASLKATWRLARGNAIRTGVIISFAGLVVKFLFAALGGGLGMALVAAGITNVDQLPAYTVPIIFALSIFELFILTAVGATAICMVYRSLSDTQVS